MVHLPRWLPVAAAGSALQARTTTGSLPGGWSYSGCLVDGAGTRMLSALTQDSSTNTPASCINFCSSKGYSIAGVEYSEECWCGNAYGFPVQTAPDSDCSWACNGDNSQTCGGSNRVQVYKQGAPSSTKTTTTSATPTGSSSGKRGLAWPATNTQNPSIFKSPQISFLYNWGSVKPANTAGLPYYAMQWSAGGIQGLASSVSVAGAKVVLAFNEPDNVQQANMTPGAAASLYKQYIHPLGASGHTLISPVVTNGGAPSGIAWLDAFFENCAGCQVDGIALHWYGGGMGDLQPFVQSAYKYNKPIYLTEFGLSWDAYAALSDYYTFLPQAMSWLDSQPLVSKYSWFGAFQDGTAKDMIGTNGSLTWLGQMYVS